MDKIYAEAFREKRLRGGDKTAHAWGSLAPGGAGSSDTKKRTARNPESTWNRCSNCADSREVVAVAFGFLMSCVAVFFCDSFLNYLSTKVLLG